MSARRSQAALSMARKKCAAQHRSGPASSAANNNKSISAGYNAVRENVNFMQLDTDAEEQKCPPNGIWEKFSCRDKIFLSVIKIFDTIVSVYIIAILCYSVFITYLAQDQVKIKLYLLALLSTS